MATEAGSTPDNESKIAEKEPISRFWGRIVEHIRGITAVVGALALLLPAALGLWKLIPHSEQNPMVVPASTPQVMASSAVAVASEASGLNDKQHVKTMTDPVPQATPQSASGARPAAESAKTGGNKNGIPKTQAHKSKPDPCKFVDPPLYCRG
jgi:hypothetical protein